MKLTTRGRFAVTSMIDLALYGEKGPVRLSDIARRQSISVAYLEQIFCKLRRADIRERYEERRAAHEAAARAREAVVRPPEPLN